jgi:hypothetical protein
MGVIFEGIDGLMPVGRKDVASVTRKALVYLGERLASADMTMHDSRLKRLTLAHGPEYKSLWGTYPDADSCEGQIEPHFSLNSVERNVLLRLRLDDEL